MRRHRNLVARVGLHFMVLVLLPSEASTQAAREGRTVSLDDMEMYFETVGEGYLICEKQLQSIPLFMMHTMD